MTMTRIEHAATPTPPRGLGRLALVVVLTAQLVVVLDFSIVNVALPSITTAFSATSTSVQWVVTAYAITFGGLLVLGGRAADQFGRRQLFVWGLAGFALASAAGGLASSLPLLIVARALQGIAAAAVAPAALSLLTTSFPEGPARTRVLGYYGIMSSVGFVAGLVLGGVIVETTTWRGVFFVNVPLCLLGAVFGRRVLPAGGATKQTHLDVVGACLVTAGVAALVYAPTAGVDDGWTSAPFVLALAAAGALLAAFGWQERRSPYPVVPPSLFRSRTLAAGDGLTLLIGAWTAGEVLILSLFCQEVLGYTPLLAGLVVVPQGIGGLMRGFAGPGLVARFGIKRFLTASAALTAVGLAVLLQFPATSRYPLLGVILLVVGFGTTSSFFAATIAGTAGITDDEQGVAGALVNTARQVGSAVGVAVLLAVATATTGGSGSTASLARGYRVAMAVSAAFAVAAVLVAHFGIRERVCQEHSDRLRRRHLDRPWPVPELLRQQGSPPGGARDSGAH
jgi:EmrB/QacA subfamily drug resistance transporter